MKKIILVCFSLSFFVSCDSSDVTWTTLFSDDFSRADTAYSATDKTVNLGINYKAYSDSGTGTVAIVSNKAVCTVDCNAEYQTPMTTNKAKLSVKFKASAFSATTFGSGVFLGDAISTGAGCQVTGGYFTDGTGYKLALVNKDTLAILASADVTVEANTQYTLEMALHDGTLETTLKSADGSTTIGSISASYADTTCKIQEPYFGASIGSAQTIEFDDFKIEN